MLTLFSHSSRRKPSRDNLSDFHGVIFQTTVVVFASTMIFAVFIGRMVFISVHVYVFQHYISTVNSFLSLKSLIEITKNDYRIILSIFI